MAQRCSSAKSLHGSRPQTSSSSTNSLRSPARRPTTPGVNADFYSSLSQSASRIHFHVLSRRREQRGWNDFTFGHALKEPHALVKACITGDVLEVVRLCDQCRLDPNTSRDPGVTPLGAAVRHSRPKVVDALLARGADPELQSWERELDGALTPLAIACKYGAIECLDVLLAAGADPTRRCRARARSPLGWAIEQANVGAVRRLVAAGAPLHVGCARGGVDPKGLVCNLMQQMGGGGGGSAKEASQLIEQRDDRAKEAALARLVEIFDLLQQAEKEAAERAAAAGAAPAERGGAGGASGTVLFFP